MKKGMILSVLLALIALIICFSQAQAKQLRLKLAWHFGPVGATADVFKEYAQKITEQSNGRIKVTTYPSASLVSSGDQYEAVKSGITDIVFNAVNDEPDAWPLNQVFIQPALGVPISRGSADFYNEAMNSIPELAQEMSEVKILFMYNSGAETNVHTTKKLVRVPNDIAGLKMIGVGAFVEYLKAVKSSPLYLTPNDFYTALERGVAEGVIVPYVVLDIMGCTELTPYHLSLDLAAPRFQLMMNLEKWNSLSVEDQEMFNTLNKWAVKKIIENNEASKEETIEKMKKLGQKIIEPTPAEFKLWQEAGIPMLEKWIKETEAKGKPARKVFEKLKLIANKYK